MLLKKSESGEFWRIWPGWKHFQKPVYLKKNSMTSSATTPEAYIESLPPERRETVQQLHQVIVRNLPKGFAAIMNYGMLGYVVPHSLYPGGYHCDPKLPLPFAGLAAQKNFIALYHMGIYADAELLNWFTAEYAKQVPAKLDMGKSCIRFKKPEHIPLKLVGQLMKKMTVKDWIKLYESNIKR